MFQVTRLLAFMQQLSIRETEIGRMTAEAYVAKCASSHTGDQSSGLREMWADLYRRFCAPKLPTSVELDAARKARRVLIVGPGFGFQANPAQGQMVQKAFDARVVHGLANPEEAGFDMEANVQTLLAELKAFGPVSVVMAASKGTYYLLELWRLLALAPDRNLHGWRGAAVMINANPTLKGKPLPQSIAGIVIAHGAADTTYPWTRGELEALIATAGHDKAFLYLNEIDADNRTRPRSDGHDMASLLRNDLLLRLVDAAASGQPEDSLNTSWLQFLSPERILAEQSLGGYKPSNLFEKWSTDGKKYPHLAPVVRRVFCGAPCSWCDTISIVPKGVRATHDQMC